MFFSENPTTDIFIFKISITLASGRIFKSRYIMCNRWFEKRRHLVKSHVYRNLQFLYAEHHFFPGKKTYRESREGRDRFYLCIYLIFSLYRVQRKLKGRPWLLEEYAAFDRLNDFYYKNHKINVFKHKINVSKHKINVFQAIHIHDTW